MKKLLLLGLVLSVANLASAERYITGNTSNETGAGGGKTGVFDCSPSTSQIDLDINNVRARILGGGDFWWDGVETAKYEIPKVDPASGATPINILFAGSLWFTGVDNGGNLQCAAQTYRNQGHDFFTGPLYGNFGEVSFDQCQAYDEHFKVYGPDIARFRALFNDPSTTVTRAEILATQDAGDPNSDPLQILRWPGKGNPYYLENETDKYYNEGALAPFFDVDGNDIYDPTKGDFPVIGVSDDNGDLTENFADQMIFWVINDNGNIHGRTGGTPMGVQVNCLAFAYQTADALNDMTFYTFEIIKKSPDPLFETYMGVFVDPDLGDFDDDMVGCDTIREMGFLYNGDPVDDQYGPNPPILGIDYFEGPLDDNGNQLGLSSFAFFINSAGNNIQQDPDNAGEFRNLQTGRWTDGTPFAFGGDGIPGGGSVGTTNYCLSGNPDDPTQWSIPWTSALTAQDYRFVQNSGPFTLLPGDPQRITIGAVTVFPNNYDGTPDIEAELGIADDLAQNLFDNNFDIIDGPDAPSLAIRELSNEIVINLVNEESSNNFGESYQEPHALPDNGVTSNDSLYRFQGYLVYQLKNDRVTAQDLNDESQARLIFQADLKDDIANVYNYTNNNAGTYNADLRVTAANEGISRTIVVTEDAFATGERALVNNKRYFFAAVSYAVAEYEPFPAISTLPDLEIFKQGRGNFRIYSAIPHVIDSRNGGTVLQAAANDPLSVFRYEGQGNGGLAIRLTEATERAVLEPPFYYEDVLEYDLGFDPIRAKVVDPLNLQNVNFELFFESYELTVDTIIGTDTTFAYIPSLTFADSSFWKINVYNDQGTIIDTILAERPFDRQYEQIIEDYGIAVNVSLPSPKGVNLENGNDVYGVVTSSITFEDPTVQWLNFIRDEGFAQPTNWIRAGSAQGGLYPDIFDSHGYDNLNQNNVYYDPSTLTTPSLFGATILEGGIAPYCLANNYANPSVGLPAVVDEDRPEYLWGPGFRWDVWDVQGISNIVENQPNNLDELRSVSIVISPNPDEWSDCVVFETGERIDFTADGTPKGALRQDDSSGPRIGKFPGYAINLETGERLNIAFGESSELSAYRGSDYAWNPTSDIEDANTPIPGLDNSYNNPIWGGMHYVYVFKTRYDNGAAAFSTLTNNTINPNPGQTIPTPIAELYDDIMYTFIPVISDEDYEFVNPADIPTRTRIDINIERPFEPFLTSETQTPEGNFGLPRYRFSTEGLEPLENQTELAESALDNIRVVPNPYYAFSTYEQNQVSNEVKIIGLPDRCQISIFTLDGKLVRQFDRAVGTAANTESSRQELSSGQPTGSGINLDNSVSWDLNNSQRIPVGSGTYIIHVDAFDLGESVVKAAIFMRPTDVSNF